MSPIQRLSNNKTCCIIVQQLWCRCCYTQYAPTHTQHTYTYTHKAHIQNRHTQHTYTLHTYNIHTHHTYSRLTQSQENKLTSVFNLCTKLYIISTLPVHGGDRAESLCHIGFLFDSCLQSVTKLSLPSKLEYLRNKSSNLHSVFNERAARRSPSTSRFGCHMFVVCMYVPLTHEQLKSGIMCTQACAHAIL